MPPTDPENNEDFRNQFLDDYYAECDEHLGQIRRHLLTIENQVGAGKINVAVLDELFRSFHTIKGISGMVGVGPAEQLAHHIEDILKALRQAELTLTMDRLDGLIAGVTLLEGVIAAHRNADTLPDIDPVVHQLKKLCAQGGQDASGAPALVVGSPRPAQEEGTPSARTWTVEFTPTPALAKQGISINSVRERLQQIGQILRSTPQVKGEGEISFQFVVETNAGPTDFPDWHRDGLLITRIEESAPPQPDSPALETEAQIRDSAAPTKTNLAPAPANIVRVDLTRLDELMRMIGEMVTIRARMEDQIKQVKKSLSSAEWRPLWETTQTMSRQLRDLREGVMAVRMVPVGEIFERMQFVVRDLARESGKKIVLDLVGRETEIDKFLVERMMDPLLHLVRNAVSHGFERPDEREAQGKPPTGRLTLRATTIGENIVIKIGDDGRGIDRAQVAQRAVAKKLLGSVAPLDDETLLHIICLPGFSTREEADRESGRGVGMDVVKRTVEGLNGTLSVSTEPGRGTTFTVQLPLTLSIAEALIVTVGPQTYAVPQAVVCEVIEVEPSDVRALERNEIVAYRDGALPLLRLSKFFNLRNSEPSKRTAFHVFVTGTGNNALGIAVDRVVGHREIVVRGIGDRLAQVPGIAGATDLGDERVVLILDVGMLRRSAFGGNSTMAAKS